jgi:putative membrane protein insertion efficiency factor
MFKGRFMVKVIISLLEFYSKNISVFLPRRCKYYPTCSAYAIEAFKKGGLFKGFLLSIWRLLRCNPFSKGGFDPVGGSK